MIGIKKRRSEALEALKKNETRTVIFYEAPHRLTQTLESMLAVLGDRQMTAARELTKRYESYQRGKISEVIAHFSENQPRESLYLLLREFILRTLKLRQIHSLK